MAQGLVSAQKRMLLDPLEEEHQQENCDPQYSAKRYKQANGLLRLLNNNESPMTELSRNMQLSSLETPKGEKLLLRPRRALPLRSFNSLCSSCSTDSNSLDDEYLAMFELAEQQTPLNKLPEDLDALISGSLKQQPSPAREAKPAARRCLSLLQGRVDSNATAPAKESPSSQARTLQRKTMSMNDADILRAMDSEPELIGDLSRPCALPVLLAGTRHGDLKTISCDTMARLMQGEFGQQVHSYQIIDCRYPYEYAGGHIRGAQNLYTRQQILEAFPAADDSLQRNIFIFHCEFSSERGPKLLRFLRGHDRTKHTHNYPALDYPELYLLHNGYKEFYALHAQLCTPPGYTPMLAPQHNEEFRHFRAKTKSWQGDGDRSGDGNSNARTLKKSRSRLLYQN